MNLVIFDVDGTLVRTSNIDDLCFARAVADEWGIDKIDLEWSSYSYSTDSGISQQLYVQHYGSNPTDQDVLRLKERYEQLLGEAILTQPSAYVEVPGASTMLNELISAKDWKVAVCSGAWRLSAFLKLSTAGINLVGAATAFADDALHRENIIEYAIARAFTLNHQIVFCKIVYVGDSLWDLRAASHLKLAFVGVEGSGRGGLLTARSGFEIVRDFTDYTKILQVFCDAEVPIL